MGLYLIGFLLALPITFIAMKIAAYQRRHGLFLPTRPLWKRFALAYIDLFLAGALIIGVPVAVLIAVG